MNRGGRRVPQIQVDDQAVRYVPSQNTTVYTTMYLEICTWERGCESAMVLHENSSWIGPETNILPVAGNTAGSSSKARPNDSHVI